MEKHCRTPSYYPSSQQYFSNRAFQSNAKPFYTFANSLFLTFACSSVVQNSGKILYVSILPPHTDWGRLPYITSENQHQCVFLHGHFSLFQGMLVAVHSLTFVILWFCDVAQEKPFSCLSSVVTVFTVGLARGDKIAPCGSYGTDILEGKLLQSLK